MEAARSISRSRHRAARHFARGLGLCALTATLLALPGSPASGAAGEPAVVVSGPGNASRSFDGEEIANASHLKGRNAILRANAGEAGELIGIPEALPAEDLIAMSGAEPAATGYLTVPRPNGTVAYLPPAAFLAGPEGPASFWVDQGCIQFFRPSVEGGANAEDRLASCGAALTVGVRDGALLTVRAAASPSSANVGTLIEFTATAEGGEAGEPITYAWSFGDGSSAAGPAVAHAFGAAGSYRVRVTASGEDESGGESAPVTVIVGNPPAGAGVGAGPEVTSPTTKPHGTGSPKGSGGNGSGRGAKGGGSKNGGKAAGKGSKGGDGKGSGSGSSKGGGAGDSHPASEPGKASKPAQSQPAGPTAEPVPTELPPIESLPSEVSPFAEAPLPALPPIPTPPPEATVPPPPATGAAPANPDAPAAGETVRGQLVADLFEAGARAPGSAGSTAASASESFASAPPAGGDSIPVAALAAAVLLAGGVLFEWRRRPGRRLR
jgi:hypothetical protein